MNMKYRCNNPECLEEYTEDEVVELYGQHASEQHEHFGNICYEHYIELPDSLPCRECVSGELEEI